MDGCSKTDMDCPQLLDLIPKDREWLVQRGEQNSHGSSEEKKLELRLGPPGEEREESSLLSLGYFSNKTNQNRGIRGFTNAVEMKPGEKGWIMNNNNNGGQTHFSFSSENPFGSSSDYMVKTQQQQQQPQGNALFPLIQSNPQRMAIKAKESSHGCPNKGEDLQQKNAEKKVFPPPPPASANPAVATNSSQKRYTPQHYFFALLLLYLFLLDRVTEDIHHSFSHIDVHSLCLPFFLFILVFFCMCIFVKVKISFTKNVSHFDLFINE